MKWIVPETGNGNDSVAVDVDPAESNWFTGADPAVDASASRIAELHAGCCRIGRQVRSAKLPSARRSHNYNKSSNQFQTSVFLLL